MKMELFNTLDRIDNFQTSKWELQFTVHHKNGTCTVRSIAGNFENISVEQLMLFVANEFLSAAVLLNEKKEE